MYITFKNMFAQLCGVEKALDAILGKEVINGKKSISVIDKIFEEKNPELTNRVFSGKGLYLISVTY